MPDEIQLVRRLLLHPSLSVGNPVRHWWSMLELRRRDHHLYGLPDGIPSKPSTRSGDRSRPRHKIHSGVGTDSFAGHHLRRDAYPPEFAIHFGSKDACRHIDRNDPTRNSGERSFRDVQWRRPAFSESLANSFADLGSALEHRRQLDDFLQCNQLGACQSHACQITHRRSPFHSIPATPQPPSSQPHRSRSGARTKPTEFRMGSAARWQHASPKRLSSAPLRGEG